MKNMFYICLLLVVGTGCSKQEPAAVGTQPTETPAATESSAPNAAPPPPHPPGSGAAPKVQPQSVAGAPPLEGRVDPLMTAQLKKFVAQKGRLPGSILELAGATSDGFPLAPAGYLYAIDPATSQVKLVKQ